MKTKGLFNFITKNFSKTKNTIQSVPTLKDFIQNSQQVNSQQLLNEKSIQNSLEHLLTQPYKFHIQTYGCQMNVNDSQIVRSILKQNYQEQENVDQADIVFLNTCAIRESAQDKIYARINQLKKKKIVGLLGCMAQRLKEKMFANGVNIICGPDAYRDLPQLIKNSLRSSSNSMNVQLSVEQTYSDITPIRHNKDSPSAFLSIMRGCNNMCSFCIVPFVRGRQRSRQINSILKEIQQLQNQGVKQITFLGQNVNSYHDISSDYQTQHKNTEGFSQTFKLRNNPGYRFAQLLQLSAKQFPDIRFRFTSPHPKDFPEEVIQKIAQYPNICNYIHLPAQSGNSQMLFKMRRNHSRQAYLSLVQRMRKSIPNLSLSTDMICGFCGQTQQQFQDTLSLIQQVKYQKAYLFAYSMRQKTHAHRNYIDDVPIQTKKQRLKRMIDTFSKTLAPLNEKQIGKYHLLLIEGNSKRDQQKLVGKTDNFKRGYFQSLKLPYLIKGQTFEFRQAKIGDYVAVKVDSAKPAALYCQPIAIIQKLSDYTNYFSKILEIENKSELILKQKKMEFI